MENIRQYNYRKCAICGVRKLPKSNTLFSSFPLDPDQCRLWVKATGDEDLIHLPIEKLHELKYLCGSHFVPEFFNIKGNRLLKTAVPTEKLTRPPLSDDTLNEFPLHVKSFYEMRKKDSVNLSPNAHVTLIGPEDMNIDAEESSSDPNIQGQDVQTSQPDDVSSTQNQRRRSRERSTHNSRRDKDRSTSDRRWRSRSRDRRDRYSRNDRNDRSRHDRQRNDDRDRRTKWENADAGAGQGVLLGNNMGNMNMGIMPGMNMMQYPNMMNMMGQQSIDGSQVQMLPNMNMIGNVMPNMMDQNMMMMNQQMMPAMMANQHIFFSNSALLPPIHGVSLRQRRDKPKGCRTIIVGGLPSNVTHDMLNEMFQRFGMIQDIKSPRTGVYYIRFERQESVEPSFFLSGFRFKYHNQTDNEATTIFIDYAMNRDDQNEFEKQQREREPTPPRVEPFTATALSNITEKIKSETDFATAAHTLAVWLERGECNKKYANSFYSLIQASNNQIRRLFNEKMQLDDEFLNMKNTIKDKFSHVVMQ